MKLRLVLLSAIVLSCVVTDGNCGVVSDVYGNVRNKTEKIKDGITGWLAYGKDWVFSSQEKPPTARARSIDDSEIDDGLVSKFYSSLINGFASARDDVYALFMSDEKKQNNGFISNMYDKVKNRITAITAYVVGDDEILKSKENDDLQEIRRALNTMINKQKSKQGENLNVLKDTVGNVRSTLHEHIDTAREKIDELRKDAGDHISGGLNDATEMISKRVNDAKDSFSSTVNHLKNSGIELSDKEREVLDAISNRIRERISNAKDAVEDPKQLSYPSVIIKEVEHE